MKKLSPRYWPIFFELFESLPRQGPGSRACAAKALALCRGLPPAPRVLDLGCGVGGQTFHLAELTSGSIVAVDLHAPSVKRLRAAAAVRELADRIQPMVGDMGKLGLRPGSFDLVWSEGALYNIGIKNALCVCHGLLRPSGHVAFTDAVWCKENPPAEVRASFEDDNATVGRVLDILVAIEKCGFSLIDHFTLPDEAWWDDFYTPMEARIEELRGRYTGDDEALAVLDQLGREPKMHRKYFDFYAYEFFVAQRVA
jgi:SAM-dependent methyltransferase